jgi:PII-like signaling protein
LRIPLFRHQIKQGRKGESMLTSGKAVKVSIYLSDGAKHHGIPVYTSLLDFLFHSGVYGATVLKGIAGFGSTHRVHSAHILEISDHLPVKIDFIETREKVDALLPELEKRIFGGLIEIQETTVIIPPKK